MKYISKAQRQLDGDLLLRTDTQQLLYRTLQEVQARLASQPDAADTLRALAALQDKLGAFRGELPTVSQLLGDPRQEMVSRNLLKI